VLEKRERPAVSVDVTPRFEIFYALQELERGAGARLANWRREMERRLPARARTEIARVAPCPLMWPLLADSLRDEPVRISVPEIVSALRSMDRSQFQRAVLAGVFKAEGAVDGLMSGRVSLKRTVAREAEPRRKLFELLGLSPFDAEGAATYAFDRIISQPDLYRDEAANAIEMFWQIGFEETWTKLEPQMNSSARKMKSAITQRGFEAFAEQRQLPLRVTPATLEIHVIPSVFNISKLWAAYPDSHERTRFFVPVVDPILVVESPLPAVRQVEEEKGDATIDPSLVFKALGDTTRYAIATTLARTPMTSVELSRLFNVSKPTISHHVQHLRAANLLIERQGENGTVLSLNRRQLERASARAASEMFSEAGPDHVVQRSRKSNRRSK
jgi:DNA-binding transcriptional ArsR family regulator